MNDTVQEILDFANKNPSCWLATSVDNEPYVRGMLMWYADETGFYFHTAKAKRMISQIEKNNRVALAFIRNQEDAVKFETLHVNGTAEFVEDGNLMEKLLKERPWLQGNINMSGVHTEVVIFRIKDVEAYVWNMTWNVRESEAPRVKF